jgi:hypothetical protein
VPLSSSSAWQGKRIATRANLSPRGGKEHSHAHAIQLGYSTGYLTGGKSFFNSKESPLVADIVVAINCAGADSRFVVLPVAFAETLCRFAADYWDHVPKRNGEGRSTSFPIYLPLRRTTQAQAHVAQSERMQRNVLAFENAWHVLAEPIDKLHDAAQWPLLP